MYLQKTLFEDLRNECARQQKLISYMEARLPHLPQGSLACRNGYYYRIMSTHGKVDQIPISNRIPENDVLIDQLQERRYILKGLPILKENKKHFQQALQGLCIYDPFDIGRTLSTGYQSYECSKLCLDGDVSPKVWETSPYKSNPAFPENLKYELEGGLFTRSKAESMIATMLERSSLSFRYEPRLVLGKHLFYPDFCILHPQDRRLLYWEHFGLMDNPEYAFDTMEKIRIYAEHGYRTGSNFIFTWETKQKPLTFKHITSRINKYFF